MNSSVATTGVDGNTNAAAPGWRELWLKEDWWAIWLGLGIVLSACLLFTQGASLKWLAVTPAKCSTLPELTRHFAQNAVPAGVRLSVRRLGAHLRARPGRPRRA